MKRTIPILIAIMLSSAPLLAQYSPCYNAAISEGRKLFKHAANRVKAELKDFDFDGVKYDVVGYTFRYKTKTGTTKETKAYGAAFTDEMKNAINGSNVGDMFVFTAIQVRGNDGKTKTLETPIGVEIN